MKIAYCRVSSTEQSFESQIKFLQSQGCEKIFQEKISGKETNNRSELNQLIDFVREGDVVHVTKVDRLARNTLDALQIAEKLNSKNVGLVCHDLGNTDINSDIGKVIFSTISVIAEFERKRIAQRVSEGRKLAKQKGKHLGRFKDTELRLEFNKIKDLGLAKSEMARRLNCSRATIYNLFNEYKIKSIRAS